MEETRENAKVALKSGNKDKATNLIRERKTLEKTEMTLRGMKMKVDSQIMDINMTLSTKSTIECLKLTANEQQIFDEEIEDAQELMDAISDQNYNLQNYLLITNK